MGNVPSSDIELDTLPPPQGAPELQQQAQVCSCLMKANCCKSARQLQQLNPVLYCCGMRYILEVAQNSGGSHLLESCMPHLA